MVLSVISGVAAAAIAFLYVSSVRAEAERMQREAVAAGEIDELRVEAFLSLAREMRVSAQSLDPDIHL